MSDTPVSVMSKLADFNSLSPSTDLWMESRLDKINLSDERHNVDIEACEVIKELYEKGMSLQDIADLLGNLSKSGVRYHVQNKCTHKKQGKITYSECGWMRIKARRNKSTKQLSKNYGVSDDTIRAHLKGECHHEDGIIPLSKEEMLSRKSSLANCQV
jgi:predicted transcriptional regulator